MNVSMIDVAVIAIYLIGITAFGIWVGFRRKATTEQYFLASHSLNWFTVGAAVFTSNISTIHLVGLAAGGAKEGMVIGNFEWMACFTLILLALIFAPFYINSHVKTLPEFMERRYCPQARKLAEDPTMLEQKTGCVLLATVKVHLSTRTCATCLREHSTFKCLRQRCVGDCQCLVVLRHACGRGRAGGRA